MDTRLPAKWRRKSGGVRADTASTAGVSSGHEIVKVEAVEQKLSWDSATCPQKDESAQPTPSSKSREVVPSVCYSNEVIDVDVELGEEDMDLSSTRSNSPIPETRPTRPGKSVIQELQDFVTTLTVMLKEDPDSVRKRATEDINSLLADSSSLRQPTNSLKSRSASTTVIRSTELRSTSYIDLTGVNDLVELPPVTPSASYASVPSTFDNQAYLSLLDSDDESPTIISFQDSSTRVKQECSEPTPEVWQHSVASPQQPPPKPSKAEPSNVHQHHKHGLLSPPTNGPTPEREHSRSVSVALLSIVPASVRQKIADPIIIKEEELPTRLGLATPPPTASKPLRPKVIPVPLPSPPLSSTDVESPVMARLTPMSPSHNIKSTSLKRKAPDSSACIIKIPPSRSEMGVIQLEHPASKGRKRRKIKSAAWVVDDDTPEPATLGSRAQNVTPRSKPAVSLPALSTIPIKVEADVTDPLQVPLPPTPQKRRRGRPPKKRPLVEEAGATKPEVPSTSSPRGRGRKSKPSAEQAVESSPIMQPQRALNPSTVKQEEPDNNFFASSTREHHTSAMSEPNLRRSRRIPKPRVKREIEEFAIPPPRKTRPTRQSVAGASSIPAENGVVSTPEPTTPRKKRQANTRSIDQTEQSARVKAEVSEASLSIPEKVFIRISAEKIRQISHNPPTYVFD